MIYISSIETDAHNYSSIKNEDYVLWRNVRVIDSHVDKEVVFADGSYCKGCSLGKSVLLNRGSFVLNSRIGDKSQIGFNTKILYAKGGKYCSISWDCSIGGSNHHIHTISTFNMNGKTHYGEKDCVIGNDVWIGAGVNVLRGLTIGDGSVIGAGSVVIHSVHPYEIVAGVPAQHIGWRFNELVRDKLLEIQWWDFPFSLIEDNLGLFEMEVTNDVLMKLDELKHLNDAR